MNQKIRTTDVISVVLIFCRFCRECNLHLCYRNQQVQLRFPAGLFFHRFRNMHMFAVVYSAFRRFGFGLNHCLLSNPLCVDTSLLSPYLLYGRTMCSIDIQNTLFYNKTETIIFLNTIHRYGDIIESFT